MSAQIKDGGPVDVLAELDALIMIRASRAAKDDAPLTAIGDLQRAEATRATVAELIEAAKMANGDHSAPHDCYATGPLTGDRVMDLVVCPGCRLAAALASVGSTT